MNVGSLKTRLERKQASILQTDDFVLCMVMVFWKQQTFWNWENQHFSFRRGYVRSYKRSWCVQDSLSFSQSFHSKGYGSLSSWNVVKAILSVFLSNCAAYWTKPVTKACESPNKAGMLMSCEFPHANQTRSAWRSDVLCKQTEIKHKVYHFKTSKTTIKSMGWFLHDFKQHNLHKEIGGVFFFFPFLLPQHVPGFTMESHICV